jgi:type IV pilus assembly protein PilW
MRPPRTSRGFTFIELVVAMAVSAIVLTAAIVAANSQQRAFHGGQRQRTAQGNARSALLYLEQTLPRAGWGMDPSLAFDFQFYTTGPCPAEMTSCSPDKTADADELIFYARNPSYWVPPQIAGGGFPTTPYKGRAWNLLDVTDSSVDLDVREGDEFLKGQILQVVCPGELRYTYFTVSSTKQAGADGPLTIPLMAAVAGDPFKRQDLGTHAVGEDSPSKDCRTFQIDRHRFHIRPVALGGGAYDPYLVLDRGVDVNKDTVLDVKDEIIVAEGIEAFQVSYTFPSPALGRAGATAGTSITFGTAKADQTVDTAGAIVKTKFTGPLNGTPKQDTQTIYAPSSFFSYRFSDPIRQTAHQANIRAVQVALVARSPEPDPSARANLVVDSGFTLLNQSGAPSWVTGAPKLAASTDGYQRVRMDTTVSLPNMTVRSIPGF